MWQINTEVYIERNNYLVGDEFSLADIAPFSTTDSAYILEAGDYVIRVGNSSRDTNPYAIIRLSEEAVTKKVRSVVASPDFEDWRKHHFGQINVRKGTGTDRDVVGKLNNGDKVKIVEEVDGWGKMENGNWISLKYTEKV